MKQIFTLAMAAAALAVGAPTDSRIPVVVELFTSEGCSSCPPADQLLAELDRKQPVAGADVIVLSEHVDYWNRLGWTDPYSSELYSARQQKYAALLHAEDVYTPQAVVDGRWETVGSRAGAVTAAIEKAAQQAKIPVTVTAGRKEGKIDVRIEWDGMAKLPGDVTVYVALAENEAQSQVRAGENSGLMLKHTAVVRKLGAVGTLEPGKPFLKNATFAVRPEWGGMRVIAFLQEKASGRIIGAAVYITSWL